MEGNMDKRKRKMSAYTSQFRRTVLHGVAAPSLLLENGESALVREGRGGGFQHRVVRRFENPKQDLLRFVLQSVFAALQLKASRQMKRN